MIPRQCGVRAGFRTFKDIPADRFWAPPLTTHRLLDFKLAADGEVGAASKAEALSEDVPHILELLNRMVSFRKKS